MNELLLIMRKLNSKEKNRRLRRSWQKTEVSLIASQVSKM